MSSIIQMFIYTPVILSWFMMMMCFVLGLSVLIGSLLTEWIIAGGDKRPLLEDFEEEDGEESSDEDSDEDSESSSLDEEEYISIPEYKNGEKLLKRE